MRYIFMTLDTPLPFGYSFDYENDNLSIIRMFSFNSWIDSRRNRLDDVPRSAGQWNGYELASAPVLERNK